MSFMFKKSYISFVLSLFFIFGVQAEVSILNIYDRDNGHFYVYSLPTEECRFSGFDIDLRRVNGSEMRDAGILDHIYFSPTDITGTETMVSFKIGTIENIRFTYELRDSKEGCEYKRSVIINGEQYKYGQVELEMTRLYLLSSVQSLTFNLLTDDGENKTLTLQSYELTGFFSLYELTLGFVFNIGSNIRENDKNTFKRTDPSVEPMPAFMIRYGPFFVNNDGAGFVLLPFRRFLLLSTFLVEGEPYQGPNLRDRRRSVYFGPLLKSGPLEVHYYRDIWSRSSGEVLKVTIAPEWRYNYNTLMSFRPFVQYWGSNYNDYYFGVIEAEGEVYRPGSAINWGATFQINHQRGRWTYINSLGYKNFGRPVRNSPLTVRSAEVRLITGAAYTF